MLEGILFLKSKQLSHIFLHSRLSLLSAFVALIFISLHKKWTFSLIISSVNVTKSAGNCGFGYIYWKNSTIESFTLRPPYLVNLHSKIVWTHSNSVVNVSILFLLECSTFLWIMFYWIFLFLSKQECFTLKYKTSLVKVRTQEKRAKLFLPNRKSLE